MKKATNNLLKIGTLLDNKWLILEFIAKGGMGEVYRAHQLNLKRDVAIKVISKQWLESLEGDADEIDNAIKRFLAEVQAMAFVRHANVLHIYDFGSAKIQYGRQTSRIEYIVMEYVPGNTLREAMSEEGVYPDENAVKNWITEYFIPVLNGVEVLHMLGIVHRDLKPENILLDKSTPKISDFGLAQSSRMRSVTRSIDVKGSPAYMSPEHFFDFRRADQRADVYSLGKILYEAVAGKITPQIAPLKSVRLPKAGTPFFQKLDQIIREATAENKEDRLESVELFRNALKHIIEPSNPEKSVVVESTSGRLRSSIFRHWIPVLVAVAATAIFSIAAVNYKDSPVAFNPPGESLEPYQVAPGGSTQDWRGFPVCDENGNQWQR